MAKTMIPADDVCIIYDDETGGTIDQTLADLLIVGPVVANDGSGRELDVVGVTIEDQLSQTFDACHQAAVEAGWWQDPRNRKHDLRDEVLERSQLGDALVAQKLCLIHSEISEAMEGHRKGLLDDHLPDREMIEVELADAVIRIADLAGAMGLDLAGAITDKMAYNAHRPDHKTDARLGDGGKTY